MVQLVNDKYTFVALVEYPSYSSVCDPFGGLWYMMIRCLSVNQFVDCLAIQLIVHRNTAIGLVLGYVCM